MTSMIDFHQLESIRDELARQFKSHFVGYVTVDNFLDADSAQLLASEIPNPNQAGIAKSRDYVFAKNKFEKSGIEELGSAFAALRADFLSPRFSSWLKHVSGEDVFVDPSFHGGGLHQGGAGSFLDMHTDFNFHPLHPDWFRNLNVLLYMNEGWRPEHGGELKLRHRHTGQSTVIEPLFNRAVIMHTRDYTLHGYDAIRFPEGSYRRSVAAYAYTQVGTNTCAEHVSTTWYPESGSAAKRVLGRLWPTLVRVKGKLIGSATARNR